MNNKQIKIYWTIIENNLILYSIQLGCKMFDLILLCQYLISIS